MDNFIANNLNTIIQGDCLDVMKQIPDKSIDHVFTSPPYNRLRNDKYSHYQDKIDNYGQWLIDVVNECIRVSRGSVIFNIQKTSYNKIDVFNLIGVFKEKIQEIIIWEKTNPMPASGTSITNAYEFIMFFSDTPIKANNTYTKNTYQTSVNSNMPKEHKAVMALDVAKYFIGNFSKEKQNILDPFAGSGTTAIACHDLKRNFICIEKEPEYHAIATKRYNEAKAQLTLF